ncbi:hypothetical protein Sjap_019800 [Stephania japonica]|uniref:Uncharacterized protein n=1 Tax=Stephania japonica TaxID=461633 RepID=A0AAP0EZG7_9MAGN
MFDVNHQDKLGDMTIELGAQSTSVSMGATSKSIRLYELIKQLSFSPTRLIDL